LITHAERSLGQGAGLTWMSRSCPPGRSTNPRHHVRTRLTRWFSGSITWIRGLSTIARACAGHFVQEPGNAITRVWSAAERQRLGHGDGDEVARRVWTEKPSQLVM